MKVELIKTSANDFFECANGSCPKSEKYFMFAGFGFGRPPWHIKPNITVVAITLFRHHWSYDTNTFFFLSQNKAEKDIVQEYHQTEPMGTEHYCPDCCKEVLSNLKKFLDPNLWIYH